MHTASAAERAHGTARASSRHGKYGTGHRKRGIKMTIRQEVELENIVSDICDEVCKYLHRLDAEELAERCDSCPMSRLFDFCNDVKGKRK